MVAAPGDWTPAVGEAIPIDDLTGSIIELFEPQLMSWDVGPEHYRFEIHGTHRPTTVTNGPLRGAAAFEVGGNLREGEVGDDVHEGDHDVDL